MGEEKKRLPVGVENFEQIINDNYYYVDKTGMISELIRNGGMVNLFTRPRRFGKTLNMSMLEHFFSIERDQSIYDGLEISKDTKLCEEYMGKYPVISISLKGINAATYEDAFDFAVRIMKKVARNVQFLLGSDALSDYDKLEYKELLNNNMSEAAFCGGLKILSELLEKHYGTKVVLLIDEYDVPLAKAFENGYYDQMIFLIRSLLEQALKTNDSLKFAMMTGCMRISKESIFTGLNNLKVLSITDERYDEYFGFTDTEVREMLKYYEIEDHYEEVKNWYDGYQFGGVEVYCPWDVLNYCDKLKDHADSFPENYWINTSSNDAVKKFIQMSGNFKTKREIETLLAGEEIIKEIHQELVYPEMYQSLENVWSLLFMTGYLTQRGRVDAKRYKLAIPNLEIRDTFVKKASKENFYHGILLGILGVKEEWYVSSNQESGEGYSDILVETENSETVILIEVKCANDGNLDQACERALQQIEEKKYDEELRENGVDKILKYGIACYMKRCKVKLSDS